MSRPCLFRRHGLQFDRRSGSSDEVHKVRVLRPGGLEFGQDGGGDHEVAKMVMVVLKKGWKVGNT